MNTKNNPATPEPFDFTKPGRLSSDNAEQWRHWLDHMTRDFREKWGPVAGSELAIHAADQAALRFDGARERFPRPAIAREITIGPASVPSILVFDRAVALGLVLQLLGDEAGAFPEDRPLSEIESSVCELLFQRLAESISESWPQKEQLGCELQGTDLFPHRNRLWEPKKRVFVCTFEIRMGEDARPLQWVLPLEELEALLERLDEDRVKPTEALKHEMEQRVLDIPVPVTVELGRTSVPVTRLARLGEGDVLLFERRISDPLPLLVDNKTKFFGWLGRVGSRQAFKVSETR